MAKLVRDKISSIIRKEGKKPEYRTVEGDEYWEFLLDKLEEEVYEFIEHPVEEELADIIEAIEVIKEVRFPHVDHAVESKRKSKGSFKKGYVLE